jgi:hypothetical protein
MVCSAPWDVLLEILRTTHVAPPQAAFGLRHQLGVHDDRSLAGSLLYVGGVIFATRVFNIPRNDALAAVCQGS